MSNCYNGNKVNNNNIKTQIKGPREVNRRSTHQVGRGDVGVLAQRVEEHGDGEGQMLRVEGS